MTILTNLSFVALASAALPPLNSIVFVEPAKNALTQSIRHCDFACSFMPYDSGNRDFAFTLVAALDGSQFPESASLQSTNYPDHYLTYVSDHPPAGRVGIAANPDAATASFDFASADGGNFSIATHSKVPALKNAFLTIGADASGPCNSGKNEPDAVFLPLMNGSPRQAFIVTATTPTPGPSPSPAPVPSPVPAAIAIDAFAVDHTIADAILGCHMDPGFGNNPMAWTSSLIYGQGFPQNEPAKIKAWYDVSTASGSAVSDPSVIMNAAANAIAPGGAPTLSLTKTGGDGLVGWANRGIGGEGLVFEGGKDYEGYIMVLAPNGGNVNVGIVDRTSNATLASATLSIPPSPDWQRVEFSGLTPSAGTICVGIPFGSDPNIDCGDAPKEGMNPGIVCVSCGGIVTVGLTSVGSLHVGFVTLQPGSWGRFNDLPVLKSGADMIQQMGFRSIRQGGSVSYSLRWKEWRGAPEARAAMNHVWGPDLVAPWGPFEFIDMANALNIKPIVTLATDSPPSSPPLGNNQSDWADLVEYLYGDDTTYWGAIRIHNDSHPAPYAIDTFELGNECVSALFLFTRTSQLSHRLPPASVRQENYHFLEQLEAIEARRKLIPSAPLWNFLYPMNQGPNSSTMDGIVAAGIDPRRVAADCHVGFSGGIPCSVESIPWAFNGSGVNCETNAVTSHLLRGVQEAADLITWFSQPANVSSRLIARTASFCIQRSGQMRDQWDQGLSFFLPNMTWLQPPGVTHQLFSKHWSPNALRVATTGGGGYVTAASQITADRSTVVVEIANTEWGSLPGSANLTVSGFAPASSVDFWLIAEPGTGAVNTTAGNTPADPTYIQAVHSTLTWPEMGSLVIKLPPLSVAVLVLHAA
jgi:hypothetical protein